MRKENMTTLHTYVDEAIASALSEKRIVGTVVQGCIGRGAGIQPGCWFRRQGT